MVPACFSMPPAFQSTHPVRGGTASISSHEYFIIFQSTHPVRGGTHDPGVKPRLWRISIHPPRAGWDVVFVGALCANYHFNPPTPCGVGPSQRPHQRVTLLFQSTHPVRGGTSISSTSISTKGFQSTHPVRGGTEGQLPGPVAVKISIHPPRAGWDLLGGALSQQDVLISIHPPRAGWDFVSVQMWYPLKEFQSTHPVRGGTITVSMLHL